jgi:1,2-diacylglycerol 3-beta-galactosyltransferase
LANFEDGNMVGSSESSPREAVPSTSVADNRPPTRLLFLIADTGGGHRASARAVIQTLHLMYPGRFAPVLCDPLGGPQAARLLRWATGLYGPSIRWAPWMWGAVYYGTNSRAAMGFLRSTLLTLVNRPVADAVAYHHPAAIMSFHPLTGRAAVRGRERGAREAPVVTVVTDLINPHMAWQDDKVDRIVMPPTAVRWSRRVDRLAPDRRIEIGLPVAPAFARSPLRPHERASLRRSLGVGDHRFLVVLTGGGEGAGGIARRAAAILRRVDDVGVVALCGRNQRLNRELTALSARSADRLIVKGFVDNMADWLRCADVVVSKAGPGTIAEATCCAAPLLLTSHVPGQEKGNTEFVVDAGAGRYAPTVRQLVREVDELRRDPSAVDAMRAASARLGQPNVAADIAVLLAGLVGVPPEAGPASPEPAILMSVSESAIRQTHVR